MMRGLALGLSTGLLALVAGSVLAEVKSGLQPGDPAPPFNVRDITGPNAGKTLCYR